MPAVGCIDPKVPWEPIHHNTDQSNLNQEWLLAGRAVLQPHSLAAMRAGGRPLLRAAAAAAEAVPSGRRSAMAGSGCCCRRRGFLSALPRVRLRLQTLQLVSLPSAGAGEKDENDLPVRGVLTEQLVPTGATVAAGAVLGRVARSVGSGAPVDVCAPRAGRVAAWHRDTGDAVVVGDDLVSVDVAEEDGGGGDAAPSTARLSRAWAEHMANRQQASPSTGGGEANGSRHPSLDMDSSFWEEHVASCRDAAALLDLADTLERSAAAAPNAATVAALREQALRVYQYLLRVLEEDRAATTAAVPEEAAAQVRVGALLHRLGDLDAAAMHLRRALVLYKTSRAPPDVAAAAHVQLAAVLHRGGDPETCLAELQQALVLQREHFGPENAVIAATLNNVGAVQYSRGDWDGAIQYYLEGLEMHRKLHGEEHADTAGSYNNLGIAYKHKGEYTKALDYLQRALRIRRQLHADIEHHPDIAASHYSLAQLLSTINEFDASLEQYRAALAIQESIYGRQHPVTASTVNNIGAVMYQQRKFADALEMYERGMGIIEAALKQHPDHGELRADRASSYTNVGLALWQMGRHEQALEKLQQALELQKSLVGTDTHPSLAVTIGAIGNVYKAQGKLTEALTEFQVAHAMLEAVLDANHPDVASSHNNIGLVYSMLGDTKAALRHYETALQAFQQSLGESHPYVGSCNFNMGLLKRQAADVPGAMKHYLDARDVWRTSLGPDHPQTIMASRAIEELQTSPAPAKPPPTP